MLGLLTKNATALGSGIFNTYVNSKVYNTNPTYTVFACINLKAKFFSSLQDETLINGEVKETFLTPLIEQSNANHSWEQVKALALSYNYGNGNTYIYTPLDKQGKPYAMYVLPSSKVKVIADSEVIDYYEYRQDGASVVRIYPNEMIHYKRSFTSPNFAEAFYLGQPKEVQQSLKLMQLEESSIDFVQSFFDADGVAPYILSATENLPPDVLKTHKAGFNNSISNNKYHVQALIGAGMRVEPLAKSSQADGLAVKESEEIVTKICRIFGVPRELLDMEFAGRATVDSVIKFFYDTSLASDVRNWEQTITRWGRQFEDGFEYNVIDYEVNDLEEKRAQEVHDLEYGIRTINDILRDRGWETVPNGDIRFLKQGLYPLDDLLYTPVEGEKKKRLRYNIKEIIG